LLSKWYNLNICLIPQLCIWYPDMYILGHTTNSLQLHFLNFQISFWALIETKLKIHTIINNIHLETKWENYLMKFVEFFQIVLAHKWIFFKLQTYSLSPLTQSFMVAPYNSSHQCCHWEMSFWHPFDEAPNHNVQNKSCLS